ncbi:peptidase S8/S53 domain-containing protein [Tanacetum coccineum]
MCDQQERIVVVNKHGDKLVGLLHDTGSTHIVVFCHGFQSSKETNTMVNLANALQKEGITAFRFDFAGNGESEGTFEYGNYRREADDLHSVIQHFREANRVTSAIFGHSKGGNVVLLYASKYHDVPCVINVSGRYKTAGGVEERLGKGFLQKVKEDGFIDVKGKTVLISCETSYSLSEPRGAISLPTSLMERFLYRVIRVNQRGIRVCKDNGEALYQPKTYKPKVRPLVYPAGMGYSCSREELKLIDVKRKIVLCDAYDVLVGSAMGEAVKKAGGAAIIFANNKLTGNSVAVEVQVLPSSHVGYREGVAIKKYLNSTSAPVATIIQRGTVLGVKSAPQVTVFSSRGPNIASPGILKPDIVGPGVDILAAWHKSVDNNTGTQATFNIISGTSMSCPHLAGVAALIKSTHPDWSPAAIKSAILTTASNVSLNGRFIVDERDHPADIFTIGSGNSGPHNKTLSNEAPWILTVGASKTDRRIRTTVTLGNKKILNGEALYQPKTYKPKVRPLVYPAGMGYSCSREELKLIDVKRKIVLCDAYDVLVGSAMGEAVKKAGGAAIIFANNKLTGNSVAVEVQIGALRSPPRELRNEPNYVQNGVEMNEIS